MKKTSLILALLMSLTVISPSYAVFLGQNLRTTAASRASDRVVVKTQNEENRITDLKTRATQEITRRVNFLTELSGKINTLKKLSASQKEDLKSQIQTQINGLNELQAKINADTDLTTLKADVKSIVDKYYIFAFFRVKISLLVAVNRMGTTTDTLNTVYLKLQTRINEKQAKGTDVTALNTLLADMLTQINSAKTQYEAATAQLNALTAEEYPGNKSTLSGAKTKIKQGGADLRTAYQDAVKIRQGLGDITGNLRKGTFDTKDSTRSSIPN